MFYFRFLEYYYIKCFPFLALIHIYQTFHQFFDFVLSFCVYYENIKLYFEARDKILSVSNLVSALSDLLSEQWYCFGFWSFYLFIIPFQMILLKILNQLVFDLRFYLINYLILWGTFLVFSSLLIISTSFFILCCFHYYDDHIIIVHTVAIISFNKYEFVLLIPSSYSWFS